MLRQVVVDEPGRGHRLERGAAGVHGHAVGGQQDVAHRVQGFRVAHRVGEFPLDPELQLQPQEAVHAQVPGQLGAVLEPAPAGHPLQLGQHQFADVRGHLARLAGQAHLGRIRQGTDAAGLPERVGHVQGRQRPLVVVGLQPPVQGLAAGRPGQVQRLLQLHRDRPPGGEEAQVGQHGPDPRGQHGHELGTALGPAEPAAPEPAGAHQHHPGAGRELQDGLHGAVAAQLLQPARHQVAARIQHQVAAPRQQRGAVLDGLLHLAPAGASVPRQVGHGQGAELAGDPAQDRPGDAVLVRQGSRGEPAVQLADDDHRVDQRRVVGQEQDPSGALPGDLGDSPDPDPVAQAQEAAPQSHEH